ncbi:DUF5667 domain-containing protein [Intrasporangium sp. DVR]|uniref:DUF5667 domain-containing protein n=1 Tax=Intrasporangium sp. DVR TaxID=3127867 RepID=UPI00313A5461
MDLGPGTDADLLQRALDGEAVDRPGIVELVTVLHAVSSLERAGLAPRDEFITDLRARLLSESHPIAAGNEAGEAEPSEADGGVGAPVSVLHLPRPIRQLAAAAAAVILLAGGLGVISRQTAPGDLLYPIKQVLDRAAVQLADGPLEVGLTHLAQAEQHVGEARDLIDRGDPDPADLTVAFDAAAGSTRTAQSLLLETYRSERRAVALTELADFVTRALPQVEAMRPEVPEAALPAWQRLHDLLAQGELEALRELASCSVCGERAAAARESLDLLLARSTAATASPDQSLPTPSPTGATFPAPVPTVPGPSATDAVPGVEVAPPAVTIGSATVGLPGAGITPSDVSVGGGGVTLPSATVNLPSLSVSSTVAVGGGGVTLPGATLPAPTLSAPALSAPTLSAGLEPTLP